MNTTSWPLLEGTHPTRNIPRPERRSLLPVAFIQEFKISGDRSTANYDAVVAQLDIDSNRPAGLIVHTAGWDENGGVFRIFDVWETAEHAERFMRERLQPILDQGPTNPDDVAGPDREDIYDLHHVVRG